MRVLVTGVAGQLGFDVCRQLDSLEIENKGVDLSDFDLTDRKAVIDYITDYKPDVIVHCAAYTAVDKAEENVEVCRSVNVDGTRNVAEVAKILNAKMMYFSTDYVFSGDGEKAFSTTDEKAPLNVYGKTKSDGEDVVIELLEKFFIIRISWVFGINGNNFIKTMLRLFKERDCLTVVSDQIGSPTYTKDLAELVCAMIQTEKYGVYHATNEGELSWYDFANAIKEMTEATVKITPVLTKDYPASKAVRPLNSRLDKSSLDLAGFKRLPSWYSALERYLDELKQG